MVGEERNEIGNKVRIKSSCNMLKRLDPHTPFLLTKKILSSNQDRKYFGTDVTPGYLLL